MIDKKILKKRLIIFVIIFVFVYSTLCLSKTFARYTSNLNNIENVGIAKPIIIYNGLNNSNTVSLTLPLDEINPGVGQKVYTFDIVNEEENRITEVNINYILTVSTTNNLPLNIELKRNDDNESRRILSTTTGEILSTNLTKSFYHSQSEVHSYTLTIDWQDRVDDYRYSVEIDVIDITVDWEQARGEV